MKNLCNRQPVQMLVMPTTRDDSDVLGFHGVPNRLEPVLRLPGEPMAALVKRTLHEVRGAGVLLVYPMLKDVDTA